MFKHGFVEKRSIPNRGNVVQHETVSLTSYSHHLSESGKHTLQSRMKQDSRDENGTEDGADSPATTLRRMSAYSNVSDWTLDTACDRASSSLASWAEDEFERETSRRVEALLNELDSALYDGAPLSNKQLQLECAEWASKFPYFRIIGKQIVPPASEKGYTCHALSQQPTTRRSRPSTSVSSKELTVVGRHMQPLSASRIGIDEAAKCGLMEEVYAEDGIYEELFAVDHSGTESRTDVKLTAAGSSHMVSSEEFLKNEIVDALFESEWPDIEQILNERRMSALKIDSTNLSEAVHHHERSLGEPHKGVPRQRSSTAQISKRPLPSAALPTYSSQTVDIRSRLTSASSRTAPMGTRGMPPSTERLTRDIGGGPIARSKQVLARLPPIDAVTTSRLPNVPIFNKPPQTNRDVKAKVNEVPMVNEEEDDHKLSVSVLPPPAPIPPSPHRHSDSGRSTITRDSTGNSKTLKLRKRQQMDSGNTKFSSEQTIVNQRFEQIPLSLVGYHQRTFSK